MSCRIIFSDIDGTLVHTLDPIFETRATGEGTLACVVPGQSTQTEILPLPISSTGQRGFISTRAMDMLSSMRSLPDNKIKLVIISGARTSTVMERLPYLPRPDAVVTENGGRIWYTDGHWKSCLPMHEDMEWRNVLSPCTGPLGNDAAPAGDRVGVLWDEMRRFQGAGLAVDSRSYSTSFRVTDKHETNKLPELVSTLAPGLVSTVNLGKADVYPAASGKANAALHIAKRMGADIGECAFLCDDDNDLELARVVGKAYLPTVSAVRRLSAVSAI